MLTIRESGRQLAAEGIRLMVRKRQFKLAIKLAEQCRDQGYIDAVDCEAAVKAIKISEAVFRR
jgi:hypothetical protein